jgi:hypothetical protein
MTLFLLSDDGVDPVADFSIAGAAAQQTPQIVVVLAEQAGAKFSVGGEPYARTVPAEGFRDR